MLQSDDVGCAPLPDFEARRALLRLNCGSAVEVTTADAFPGWMRPLNACGVEAGSVKIQRIPPTTVTLNTGWSGATGTFAAMAQTITWQTVT